MYRIYNTPSYIISLRNQREADRLLTFITKDFGQTTAIARGVRYEKSKLRYHLQLFSHLNLSLVKGKEFWRVTGAEPLQSQTNPSKHQNKLLAYLSGLIRKLTFEDETDSSLYYYWQDIENKTTNINDVNYSAYKIYAVGKLLTQIGYFDPDTIPYLQSDELTPKDIKKLLDNKEKYISLLTNSLHDAGV